MSRETPFVDFPAGSTMLREGEAASALFIIEAGKAAIERGDTQLAELGPGDVFGEAALLQELGHAANVVARTAVRALRLDSATLPAVIRENVDVATLLMRRLAQRLRAADELVAGVPTQRASGSPAPESSRAAPVAGIAAAPAVGSASASASISEPAAVPSARAAAPRPAEPVPAVAAAPAPSTSASSPPAPSISRPGGPAASQPVPPTVEAVDTRARTPAVAPAPAGAPAPTAQAVPNGPPVVRLGLRHAQGVIAIPADQAECLVGRPDPATGAVPEINLGPLDLARSLSRRHARLLVTGNTVSLREEPGVANGTWINGERIPPGQTVQLKPGDKLRFGAIELEFGTV